MVSNFIINNSVVNGNKQTLVLGSVFSILAAGLGYLYLKQTTPEQQFEINHEKFYKDSINKYLININKNKEVINIIITFSSNIPNEIVKKTAKYIYNNVGGSGSVKINIFSIEYSEIEHFNDIKEKSTFDAIIVIDDHESNKKIHSSSLQTSISDSIIKKFSKISTILKPSSPFLTFYYQKQQETEQQPSSTSSLNNHIEEQNEIVNWMSNNIIENKSFYELCGFKVESTSIISTNSTTQLCLVATKSPDYLINSRDTLLL